MLWLWRDGDTPAIDYGVERALDRLEAPIAMAWSKWILDNSLPRPTPIRRNFDGERIPVEGRNPFYTFYAWDRVATRWTAFYEVEWPDARLPKYLEKDLWLNRNKHSDRAKREREEREALKAAQAASRDDDQRHWIKENFTYWKDALEGNRDAGFHRAARIYSGPRHSYRGDMGIVKRTRREQGLTPHPRGRDDY